MKVICIDGVKEGAKSIEGMRVNNDEILIEGAVYTVIRQEEHYSKNYYFLKGKPFNTGYWEKKFAICSDIDETELVNEKEIVNA